MFLQINLQFPQQQQAEQHYEDSAGDQFSTIKRSPYSKQNSNNSQVTTPVETEPPASIPTTTIIAAQSAAGGGGGGVATESDTKRGVVIQNGKF